MVIVNAAINSYICYKAVGCGYMILNTEFKYFPGSERRMSSEDNFKRLSLDIILLEEKLNESGIKRCQQHDKGT